MLSSTNSFGLRSSSPLGSPSVSGSSSLISFGQSMFGNSNQFGSNITSSTFGTSTGVFGNPSGNSNSNSHPYGLQTSTGLSIGTSSAVSGQPSGATASGSLTPTPVFGYMTGQQPTAGALGSNSNQSNLFGSSNAFGSNITFGAPDQYAFGATSSSGFGQSSTGFGTASSSSASFVFGQSCTPAFDTASSSPVSFSSGQSSTPAFDTASSSPALLSSGQSSTPAFGTVSSSPALFISGQLCTPFGTASSSPALFSSGQSRAPAFGAVSSSPALFSSGQSSTPAFGTASSSPALFSSGQSSTFGTALSSPALFSSGQSSTPAFGTVSSSPALFSFGQSSTPAFGTTSYSPALSGSGRPSASASGTPLTTRGYCQVGLVRRQGTRVTPYAPVEEGFEKYMSISLMPQYMDKKSHEELRWEDYRRGDKGGSVFCRTGSGNQQGSGALPYAEVAAVQQRFEEFISISLMPAYIFNKSNEELRWEDYQRGNRGSSEFRGIGSSDQQGSRIVPYAAVQEGSEKYISISFMPPYKHRSHEELRWEDYQRGDEGSFEFGQTGSDYPMRDKHSIKFGQTSSDYRRGGKRSIEFGRRSTDKGVQTEPPSVDDRDCPICLTNLKNMAFNCGHQICTECGPKLQTCPICRTKIYFRLRLY